MHDLPIDRLGPYPILQLAAALLVLGGLAVAIWRGQKDRKKDGGQLSSEQRWFFDGPIVKVLEVLHEQKDFLKEISDDREAENHERRRQTELLQDIRNALNNQRWGGR